MEIVSSNPSPPSMTLDKGNLAPRQPSTPTMETRPANTPAATFTRSTADLRPDVYTDPRGNLHFNSAQGNAIETKVTKPTNPPTTPLSRMA